MDIHGLEARTISISAQAAKGVLHAAWMAVALHPRAATVTALILIAVAFAGGIAVGVKG